MAEFTMPSLGADMTSGTVIEWKVLPGDRVRRGQIVAVVETTKGAIEIEIFADAVIEAIVVPVGTEVPVGAVLATYRELSDSPAPAAPGAPSADRAGSGPSPAGSRLRSSADDWVPAAPGAPSADRAGTATHAPPPLPPPIAPAARKLAAELGVDVRGLHGTGYHGSITSDDVRAAAAAAPAAGSGDGAGAKPSPAPRAAPSSMRETIAAAMARSKREIPHYYLAQEIDMARALEWLREANAVLPMAQRLLPAALLYRATALALRHDAPELNGFYRDGAAALSSAVHLGVAISLKREGLMLPAILDAESLHLAELMAALNDLIERARSGGLRARELSSPTVTVTSLGDRGVDRVYGVIVPPQLCIVGFGRIAQRAVAVGDAVAAHPVVVATVSGDHRASDGFHAARLLNAIDRRLQKPEEL